MIRIGLFLAASFISAFGDYLLFFSLPNGLGIESGDYRLAVLAWLIPGISVFFAGFFDRRISDRLHSTREDYAKLLLVVAGIEVLTAIAALVFRDKPVTVVLICLFLFLYAFVKEGIPRLLYTVSIYRYFAADKDYERIAGFKSSMDIMAVLFGTLAASHLVSLGQWRTALLIDAASFVVLGLVLWLAGRTPLESPADAASRQNKVGESVSVWGLRWILFAVPALHGINALSINYLPLINDKLGVLDVSSSIAMIAFLRFPGLLAGMFFGKISRAIQPTVLMALMTILYLAASFLFLILPAQWTFIAVVLIGGLNMGLGGPADVSIRNRLPTPELIRFNALVLRLLAGFQVVACLAALCLFSKEEVYLERRLGLMVLTIAVAAAVTWWWSRQRFQ
jgi:hypothetical protein